MDPYQPPTDADSDRSSDPVKPRRIWVLQGYAALQVVIATGSAAWFLLSAADAALDWPELALKVLPALGLVLSLQRSVRRARIVAPVSGFLWWSYWTYSDIRHFLHPLPGPLDRYKFQNVPPSSEAFVDFFFRAFWLYMVGSLIFDEKCRLYLGDTVTKPPPPNPTAGRRKRKKRSGASHTERVD